MINEEQISTLHISTHRQMCEKLRTLLILCSEPRLQRLVAFLNFTAPPGGLVSEAGSSLCVRWPSGRSGVSRCHRVCRFITSMCLFIAEVVRTSYSKPTLLTESIKASKNLSYHLLFYSQFPTSRSMKFNRIQKLWKKFSLSPTEFKVKIQGGAWKQVYAW